MSDINAYTAAEIAALTPLSGDLVLNTDDNAVQLWNGSAWKIFNSDVLPFNNGYSLSLSFDGSDDYVDIGNITALNSVANASFSFWYKTNAGVNETVTLIGDASKGLSAYHFTDGNMYVHSFVGGSSHSIPNPTAGAWHHVACTFEASGSKLYIDGSLVSTVDHGNTTASTCGNDFSIGRLTGYSNMLGGQKLVDEVALFTSTLSAPDIASLRDTSGANAVPADISSLNPVGWWRMGDNDGGAGDTITDQGVTFDPTANDGEGGYVPSGNDGTLANGPTFVSGAGNIPG